MKTKNKVLYTSPVLHFIVSEEARSRGIKMQDVTMDCIWRSLNLNRGVVDQARIEMRKRIFDETKQEYKVLSN